MSNVRIEATGEVGLRIAVVLGPNERASHLCPANEGIDLTVGGNQTLTISEDADAPTAEADAAVPLAIGADISELPEAPEVSEAEPETEVEGAGENPLAAEMHDLDADSPLEQGTWPGNPFDDEEDDAASA